MKPIPGTVELLRRHFPEASDEDISAQADFVGTRYAVTTAWSGTVDRRAEIDRIERIRSLATSLAAEYNQLPLGIGKGRDNLQVRIAKISHDLTGEAPGHFFGGESLFPRKTGALDLMRGEVNDMIGLTAKRRDNEGAAKARLVAVVRECWASLSTRRAPDWAHEGPFMNFLRDVIELHGKTWSAEKTLAAWRWLEGEKRDG